MCARQQHRDFEGDPLKVGEIRCLGRGGDYSCMRTSMTAYKWFESRQLCGACYSWLAGKFLLEKDGSTAFLSGDGMCAADFDESQLAPFTDEFEQFLDQKLGKQQKHGQTYTGPEHSCAEAGDGPTEICNKCHELKPILAGGMCEQCIVGTMPKSGDVCEVPVCTAAAKQFKGVCEKCNKVLLVMPRSIAQSQQYAELSDPNTEWHKMRFVPGYRQSASGLQKHVDDCIVGGCVLKCMNAQTGGCDVHSIMIKMMGSSRMSMPDQDHVKNLQTKFMEDNNRCVICPVHQQKQWIKPAQFADLCGHHFNNYIKQECSYDLECTRGNPEENHETRIRKLKEGYANKAIKRAELAEAAEHQAKLLRELKELAAKRDAETDDAVKAVISEQIEVVFLQMNRGGSGSGQDSAGGGGGDAMSGVDDLTPAEASAGAAGAAAGGPVGAAAGGAAGLVGTVAGGSGAEPAGGVAIGMYAAVAMSKLHGKPEREHECETELEIQEDEQDHEQETAVVMDELAGQVEAAVMADGVVDLPDVIARLEQTFLRRGAKSELGEKLAKVNGAKSKPPNVTNGLLNRLKAGKEPSTGEKEVLDEWLAEQL